MNKLSMCKIGDKVKILKLHADYDLKQRLISFGIMKNAEVEVLEHSASKSTIEIKVGKMKIALRSKEAQLIEVEKI
ncbi:MAG TPA: iron transporter [Sulfurimonas sp. UBA12504]|jgi:ferrous iron transport protein A|nr:MAG: iron transporter [Sulfurimonas sp. GWF2_37_8]DAB30407.1 MAG TPA: iron transporter [Sulfurimonas sp. UBA12504]